MNTHTHIIMGAALFGGKVPKHAWAGAAGGLLPDVPMLAIVLALKIYGLPNFLIFTILYWQNWWQVTNAIAHNFFLWGAMLSVSLYLQKRAAEQYDKYALYVAFGAAGFTHCVIDLLSHREDAHMQFWPLTTWKFMSPVSYWQRDHYGLYLSAFEIVMGLTLAAILMSRFNNHIVRAALAITMIFYFAVPAYFMLL